VIASSRRLPPCHAFRDQDEVLVGILHATETAVTAIRCNQQVYGLLRPDVECGRRRRIIRQT
jgi:hypothetical protein